MTAPTPTTPTTEAALRALARVVDPEVGLDIVTLGLVYDLSVEAGRVHVTYTLTTPGCPLEGVLTNGILATLYALPGVEHVDAELVWEPRWTPDRIADDAWSDA